MKEAAAVSRGSEGSNRGEQQAPSVEGRRWRGGGATGEFGATVDSISLVRAPSPFSYACQSTIVARVSRGRPCRRFAAVNRFAVVSVSFFVYAFCTVREFNSAINLEENVEEDADAGRARLPARHDSGGGPLRTILRNKRIVDRRARRS